MKRLVFVDAAGQAESVHASGIRDASTRIVALTSDAMRRFEALGVDHSPAAAYADLHPLADADEAINVGVMALASEIERYLTERHAPIRFDGPGLLTGHSYWLQYSATAIVRRVLLMRQAIEKYAPSTVVAFDGADDPWFRADGYVRDPWLDVLRADGDRGAFTFELHPAAEGTVAQAPASWTHRIRRVGSKIRRRGRRVVEAVRRPAMQRRRRDRADLKLLFAVSTGFDWRPVIDDLKGSASVCHHAAPWWPHPPVWAQTFEPRLRALNGSEAVDLDIPAPAVDNDEGRVLLDLLATWVDAAPSRRLEFAGVDVLPGLLPQIRGMLRWSPALVRYGTAFATAALDRLRPDAVCFFAIGELATRRLAFDARQRGVPAVSYQHGFGYSVRVQPQDEQSDAVHADYFLTYGEGNGPRPNPAFPVRAEYVPIGSARIERLRERFEPSTAGARPRVLWVSEFWNDNTLSVFTTEETGRFMTYRSCLSRLAAAGVQVTYRPYPGCADPVAAWLAEALPSVRISAVDAFEDALAACDVAVVATSSPTVWGETLALGVPTILFCDPQQTLLTAGFMRDLDRVCRWCTSSAALAAEIEQLVSDAGYIDRLRAIETAAFVRKYVLHEGGCADRAIAFLDQLGHARRARVPGDARVAS